MQPPPAQRHAQFQNLSAADHPEGIHLPGAQDACHQLSMAE